ncbi:hypothetical protein Tco_0283173 [Tanacetum coccineum]
MRADELHKFSDGMLDDVRSALNDIAKGVRMEYLPKMGKLSSLDNRRARIDKVLKLKNIKKDGYTRFQHQEQYEHVGPEVTRSQEGKRSQDDDKRLCLVDDLKEFKITFMSSQRYKSEPKVNDHYNISQVEVKKTSLRAQD